MEGSLLKSKLVLAFCNFLLLVSGCLLLCGGLILLLDQEKLLLSRLLLHKDNSTWFTADRPPLYYAAIGIAILGLILGLLGILGCWVSCTLNQCFMSIYFILVTVLLIAECAIYTTAWLWPNCLGLIVDTHNLMETLQNQYGTAGNEQLTAAVDLAQVTFNCCGIKSPAEYNSSIWKLQGLTPGLNVPLTCCRLSEETGTYRTMMKKKRQFSYLDPKPINVSLCQAIEVGIMEGYRFNKGCSKDLEKWYQEQYVIFLACGLILVLVEFVALLGTVFSCTVSFKIKTMHRNSRLPKQKSFQERSGSVLEQKRTSPIAMENTYQQYVRKEGSGNFLEDNLPFAGTYRSISSTSGRRPNYSFIEDGV